MTDQPDWTTDLKNVAEVARIDQIPEPHCVVWANGVVTITVDTDHQATLWEHAMGDPVDLSKMKALDLAYEVTMGRIDGGTVVKVAVASDVFEHHIATAIEQALSHETAGR